MRSMWMRIRVKLMFASLAVALIGGVIGAVVTTPTEEEIHAQETERQLNNCLHDEQYWGHRFHSQELENECLRQIKALDKQGMPLGNRHW